MIGNQIDTFIDIEVEDKRNEKALYTIGCIYFLLIVSFIVYYFWPFYKAYVFRIFKDTELQMLTAIHVIYPSIGLVLFMGKNKLGWSLLVFSSMINATYGIFAYTYDLFTKDSPGDVLTDKMFYFFLAHIFIIIFMFRQSIVQNFSMNRKYFLNSTWITVIISGIFLLLLLTTFN